VLAQKRTRPCGGFGFLVTFGHEKDRNSSLTQKPRQEEAEAPCEASEQAS
jgi:hypothetical protein